MSRQSAFQIRMIFTTLTFVLVIFFVWLVDWRFNIFLKPPNIVASKDLGFRFNVSHLRCEDKKSQPGFSPDFFGRCGRIYDAELNRVKIENIWVVGASFEKVQFQNFLIEWMIAPSSDWNTVRFVNGHFGEADMRSAVFRNVTFQDLEMTGSQFIGARFENCIFRNVKMRDVSFRFSYFSGTDLENVNCYRCDFRNSQFENSKISGDFIRARYNAESILPIPLEDLGFRGFEYVQ